MPTTRPTGKGRTGRRPLRPCRLQCPSAFAVEGRAEFLHRQNHRLRRRALPGLILRDLNLPMGIKSCHSFGAYLAIACEQFWLILAPGRGRGGGLLPQPSAGRQFWLILAPGGVS
jgi:hypothetical protein